MIVGCIFFLVFRVCFAVMVFSRFKVNEQSDGPISELNFQLSHGYCYILFYTCPCKQWSEQIFRCL